MDNWEGSNKNRKDQRSGREQRSNERKKNEIGDEFFYLGCCL